MKVIFLKDDKNVKKGTVKEVSDGFAKNFLIPNGIVIQATQENLNKLKNQEKEDKVKKALKDTEIMEFIALLESKEIVISRKRAGNRMVQGSITKANISDAVLEQIGVKINSKDLKIEQKYFCFGWFSVSLKLGSGKIADLKIKIIEEI